jgi:PKD repeat protein
MRSLAVVLAMLAVIGGLTGPAAALDDDGDPGDGGEIPGDPPVGDVPVAIDWRMPSRFGGDRNQDGLIDYMAPSDFCSADDATTCSSRPKTAPQPIAPTSWHVDLYACASQLAHGEGATFDWEIVRGPGTITLGSGSIGTPACSAYDLVVPAEGVYRVKLTISSSLGSASAIQDVTVQDWLILSMGDSYGSGEGNPDIEVEHGLAGVKVADAEWQDRRCHRSADAGSAQAARWLEEADPRTSVTFIHVACSGAEAMAGLLETYAGVGGTWEAAHMAPLDPQITQARELVAGREIDATYISIGGNDSNFAKIVMSCIALAPCNPRYVGADDAVHPDLAMVIGTCAAVGSTMPPPANVVAIAVCLPVLHGILADFAGDTAENHFRNGLQGPGAVDGVLSTYRLTEIYGQLAAALHASGPVDGRPFLGMPDSHRNRVFLSEYVDATQDDEGDYCPKGDIRQPLNDIRIPGLGQEEYEWIDLEVERKLNEVIAFNAQDKGWNLVDGIHAGFATHGICAEDTYMVGLLAETFWRQDNMTGAAHPNVKGHQVYRNRIISEMLPTLYPGSGGESLDLQNLAQVRGWIADHAPRLPAQAPQPDAGGPYTLAEGSTVVADNGSFDDGALTSTWATSSASVATVGPATATNPTIGGVDDGEATLTLTVTDVDGNVARDTAAVNVTNVAPTVTAGASTPIVLDEGDLLAHTATYADPGVLDTHTASVDFGDGTVSPATAVGGVVSLEHTYVDEGTYRVRIEVTDDDGGVGTASFPVTVRNVAPMVDPVVAPLAPVLVRTAITADAAYTDPGADAHTLTWAWGDGSSTVEARGVDADGPVMATHVYAAAGLYTVTLTVDDGDGGITVQSFQYVVVYDPAGGFTAGGGTIESPAGALRTDPSATGRAVFGFVAKYKKGQSVPDGNTSFRFNAGDFALSSTSYDWLVVSGTRAQYKGRATVNGVPGYGFMLSVVDGDAKAKQDPDQLRLKVWHLDNGSIVYDNQLGAADDAAASTAISGGQISINGG